MSRIFPNPEFGISGSGSGQVYSYSGSVGNFTRIPNVKILRPQRKAEVKEPAEGGYPLHCCSVTGNQQIDCKALHGNGIAALLLFT